MATPKHVADASEKIGEYINNLPPWSNLICNRLRQIVLKSDPEMIEDWKWGPNYYLNGMVAGFAAFKKHVNFVFFNGAHLKDKRKMLGGNLQNLNIRTISYREMKEINEDHLLEYLMEAIDNNKKGLKPNKATNKTLVVPNDIKKEFIRAGVMKEFESSPYSHRKEYVAYIEEAKKKETRLRRIEKAISKLSDKMNRIQVAKKK